MFVSLSYPNFIGFFICVIETDRLIFISFAFQNVFPSSFVLWENRSLKPRAGRVHYLLSLLNKDDYKKRHNGRDERIVWKKRFLPVTMVFFLFSPWKKEEDEKNLFVKGGEVDPGHGTTPVVRLRIRYGVLPLPALSYYIAWWRIRCNESFINNFTALKKRCCRGGMRPTALLIRK